MARNLVITTVQLSPMAPNSDAITLGALDNVAVNAVLFHDTTAELKVRTKRVKTHLSQRFFDLDAVAFKRKLFI